MKIDVEKRITYFKYCGEANTEKVLHLAKSRCEETGINKVVIASETGRSAIKALGVFKGAKIELIVVTHYPASTWGPKGEILIGLKRKEYSETLKKIGRKPCENCPRNEAICTPHPLNKLGISNTRKHNR